MNNRALAFIFFCTAPVEVLALGIVVKVMPMLLLGFVAGNPGPKWRRRQGALHAMLSQKRNS